MRSEKKADCCLFYTGLDWRANWTETFTSNIHARLIRWRDAELYLDVTANPNPKTSSLFTCCIVRLFGLIGARVKCVLTINTSTRRAEQELFRNRASTSSYRLAVQTTFSLAAPLASTHSMTKAFPTKKGPP